MATTIRTKRTVDAGKAPAAGSLALGELAVNVTDKKLWVGDASGDPQELVGGTGGGGGGLHNDLDGRTVALCHPLASIYDPADGDKNLADILTDLDTSKVEEPPSTPINTYYARGFDNKWHAIDLSVPTATWGSITGNISAQSDLFSTFAAKSSSNTIIGVWTFTGYNGGGQGIRLGSYGRCHSGTNSSNPSVAIQNTNGDDYCNASNSSSGVVCAGYVLGVTNSGSVIQPSLMSADQVQFVTNKALASALRTLAAAPPPALVTAMAETPQVMVSTLMDALADVFENTDFGTPDHDAIEAKMRASFTS